MKSYKKMKKGEIDISERKSIRDKIWNYLKGCWLFEELAPGTFERVTDAALKDFADDIVGIIYKEEK